MLFKRYQRKSAVKVGNYFRDSEARVPYPLPDPIKGLIADEQNQLALRESFQKQRWFTHEVDDIARCMSGGYVTFGFMPSLDVSSVHACFITPEVMPHPMMRGVDLDGQIFIALKVIVGFSDGTTKRVAIVYLHTVDPNASRRIMFYDPLRPRYMWRTYCSSDPTLQTSRLSLYERGVSILTRLTRDEQLDPEQLVCWEFSGQASPVTSVCLDY